MATTDRGAPSLQFPYPIVGHIYKTTRASGADTATAQRGALVWAQDITEGTFKYREKDVSLVYTNTEGEYIIDIANITSAYANGDTVRIYVKVGDMKTYEDITLATAVGVSVLNITFPNKSELTDGLKGTLDDDGQYGLESMGKGMKKGLQDGM